MKMLLRARHRLFNAFIRIVCCVPVIIIILCLSYSQKLYISSLVSLLRIRDDWRNFIRDWKICNRNRREYVVIIITFIAFTFIIFTEITLLSFLCFESEMIGETLFGIGKFVEIGGSVL